MTNKNLPDETITKPVQATNKNMKIMLYFFTDKNNDSFLWLITDKFKKKKERYNSYLLFDNKEDVLNKDYKDLQEEINKKEYRTKTGKLKDNTAKELLDNLKNNNQLNNIKNKELKETLNQINKKSNLKPEPAEVNKKYKTFLTIKEELKDGHYLRLYYIKTKETNQLIAIHEDNIDNKVSDIKIAEFKTFEDFIKEDPVDIITNINSFLRNQQTNIIVPSQYDYLIDDLKKKEELNRSLLVSDVNNELLLYPTILEINDKYAPDTKQEVSIHESYLAGLEELENNYKAYNKIIRKLEPELNIKRLRNNEYYYYDNETERYQKLDERRLGVLIRESEDISLKDSQLKGILELIQRIDKPNNYLWKFRNDILDIRNFKTTTYNMKEFTVKTAGYMDEETDEFKQFNYNPDIECTPNFKANAEITLVQKTLQEILIPKGNKKDTRIYYDFLQRVGSCFYPYNRHKHLAVYIGKGNNGKGILNNLIANIFNNHYVGITPKQLNDQFIEQTLINDKNVLGFDELETKSFEGNVDIFKRLSGGIGQSTTRTMYKQESQSSKHYGTPILYTNTIPDIEVDDKAFLGRLDIITLPNSFVESRDDKDYKINEYPLNRNLINALAEDKEGLQWLTNASLKQYRLMEEKKETFILKQTADETIEIIKDENHLLNYIMKYIEETGDKTDIISNADIRAEYQEYRVRQGLNELKITNQKFGIDVGIELTKAYPKIGDHKGRQGGGIIYIGYKIKTIDEVEAYYKGIYVIDEESPVNEYGSYNDLQDEERIIYKYIKANSYVKYEEIKKAYQNIKDIGAILISLTEQGYIKKDDQTGLTEDQY